jgi:DNA modification methylase
LDCFCGTGTTGVAARLLGRAFTGIDLSGDYCRVARERLASACPLDDAAWSASPGAPVRQPTLFGEEDDP